jgi:hypothetical protein
MIYELINDEWVWQVSARPHRACLRMQWRRRGCPDVESFLTSCKVTDEGVVNPNAEYWAVIALLTLGRKDDAMRRLEYAIDNGWRNVWWARRDPCLQALSKDPRFEALLSRVPV